MPETIRLPEPCLEGSFSIEAALAGRRSVREYSDRALTQAEISQLLWAAQGFTDARGHRAAPSAGATYPLEVYLVTGEGFYHYDPRAHTLTSMKAADLRPDLFLVAQRQEHVLQAPVTMVFAAVFQRTAQRYGQRAPRYVHMEVGHAAENVMLQAVALGLGTVAVGAFDDKGVHRVLDLPGDHEPLYMIPIGHSA